MEYFCRKYAHKTNFGRKILVLIRFRVSNYRSFADEVVFSMVPAQEKHHEDHKIDQTKFQVLRMAAIYGANGAGKSNLLRAMHFAQHLVLRGVPMGSSIRYSPFKLNQDLIGRPSVFNFDFAIGDSIYNYGLAVDHTKIVEEWLYRTSELDSKNEELFFFRSWNEGKPSIEIGNSMYEDKKGKDFVDFVFQGTRPEQPFLTECRSRNHALTSKVYDWFRSSLLVLSPRVSHKKLESMLKTDKDFAKSMGGFLKRMGTGVDVVYTKVIELSEDESSAEIRHVVELASKNIKPGESAVFSDGRNRFVVNKLTDGSIRLERVFTGRKLKDGTVVEFKLHEESDGTQKLIQLFPAIYGMRDLRNKTLIIDEFENGLHPLVSRQMIQDFVSSFKSSSCSQLIFTTHEDQLLDLELFRKDEIWFAEKNEANVSKIYSLAEFKPRVDLKINKHYLQGRFGGIPFISDPKRLGW